MADIIELIYADHDWLRRQFFRLDDAASDAELQAICTEHENTGKDHPEQWETLADFTEELEDALPIYQKALDKAVAKQSNDHIASIGFSMAALQVELGDNQAAIERLQQAQASAHTIEDNELKAEIDELLATLTTG
mgnify:CR=1 FL=1